MARVRAAVLAAGRGVRIGGDTPKTLLPVAGSEPLLHYVLTGLRRAGVDEVLVVTGFGARSVQEFVTERWGEAGATFVFNARFASWGNFHTVRLALEQSPGYDVLVVNSDVVVPPDVYRRAIETQGDLVLAVQRRLRLDEEDMRVELEGSVVRQIGKHVKTARSHAEYAGVSVVRREAARVYLDIATDLEWRARTAVYYEDVYAAMLDRVVVRAALVGDDEYAEVDVPDDFDAAAAVIEWHRASWGQTQEATEPAEPQTA